MDLHSKSTQTVAFTVLQTVAGMTYKKTWRFLTYRDALVRPLLRKFNDKIERRFWDIEKRRFTGFHPLKSGTFPTVTDDRFLGKISWVGWRTQASFQMPCSHCGSHLNVEMHHIKHVRKRAYKLIPTKDTFTQIMALRNRKLIPLCQKCHRGIIHKGTYSGKPLINLAPTNKMYDNRILHLETFIRPTDPRHHAKSLEQKGWVNVDLEKFLKKEKEKIKSKLQRKNPKKQTD